MKIINLGILPPQKEYKIKCGHCGCKFNCDKTELIKNRVLPETRLKVKCPGCKQILYKSL